MTTIPISGVAEEIEVLQAALRYIVAQCELSLNRTYAPEYYLAKIEARALSTIRVSQALAQTAEARG